MCNVLEQNVHESIQTSLIDKPASLKLKQDLLPLETICEQMNQILSPLKQKYSSEQHVLDPNQPQSELKDNLPESYSPSIQHNNDKPSSMEDTEMKDVMTESEMQTEGSVAIDQELVKEPIKSLRSFPKEMTNDEVEIQEVQNNAVCSRGMDENDMEVEETKTTTETKAEAISNEDEIAN